MSLRARGWVVLACVLAGALVFWFRRPGSAPPHATPPSAAGPTSVPALLARLADQADPLANSFLNAGRVAALEQELSRIPDRAQALDLWVQLGEELLLAGRSVEAVQELEKIQRFAAQQPQHFDPGFAALLQDLIAVAYLRVGEQENCLANHNADSCLMPIAGGGVHVAPRGSRAALKAYRAILAERPGDLGARWLLNLAAMTLGEYPDSVADVWRIPPAAFASEAAMPRFSNVAVSAGVAELGLSGGAIMEDFNGDGWLDLMASSWGLRDQLRYYENQGDGRFVDRTAAAGLTGQWGGLNLTHADYDNDGDADVLVLRGAWLGRGGRHPNSLLRNRGDGTFEDVTIAAGLLSRHPTQTAAWGDYDNDGWLDLFIGNETGNRMAFFTGKAGSAEDAAGSDATTEACELFRNNGDGTFTNVAAAAGVAVTGFVKGVAWGDYDNDGRADLYLSRLGEPNLLFRNAGPRAGGGWRFLEVGAAAGVRVPQYSFPTWFWDYDNDGWLDLFVGGYSAAGPHDIGALYLGRATGAEPSRLFHNNGDGTFTDVTAESGLDRGILVMGANYGDIDNDGYPDCYVGTGAPNYAMLLPNRMFRNAAGARFADVTTAGGFGNIQKGHGIAFGDVDNDGDQDIFEVMGGAYSGDVYPNALYLNPGAAHHWVILRLEGVSANRAGVGARVRVRVETPGGARDIYATVGTGGSFGSSSLQQEIGLGAATRIVFVEIQWPGSEPVQRLTDVPMDQCVRIRQGATAPQVISRPSLRPPGFGGAPVAHVHPGPHS